MDHKKPFAEIIESSLSSWQAQCWQWDDPPAYGSLLTISTPSRTLFGIVHDIVTGSTDTNRAVFTYKKNEEELKRDHPHIFEFLHTTFRCLALGYSENNRIQYQLAPEPPKIHSFVSYATTEELTHLFAHEQYLHMLFTHAHQIFSLDDLLLSLIKRMNNLNLLNEERLQRFTATFSLLTANDYRRLKLFLQRAQAILNPKAPTIRELR